MLTSDEREFRLRPRRPQVSKTGETAAWATSFKTILHYARMSRKGGNTAISGGAKRGSRPYNQRCAVRITYTRSATRGQWRAHGRYIAREGATREIETSAAGFDARTQTIDVARRLEEWQAAGDERLWKLIISPEFGERVDLKRLTRDLMAQMEKDLGTDLEWVGVVHHNTEHPHVHVALRGIDSAGRSLRLSREYVKYGVREIAEDLCTRQLGFRSEWDAAIATKREVHEHRYTSLDRIISRSAVQMQAVGAEDHQAYRVVVRDLSGLKGGVRLREQYLAERLMVLQSMGLATLTGPGAWLVRHDFEGVLRSMQRINDRQKTLAAYGVVMSDERLPIALLDFTELKSLEGRVLVHGEEEDGRDAGRRYLMLEGTDARVRHVYYTPAMEEARSRGGLRINSFIRLRRLPVSGAPAVEIEELGDAEAVLQNRRHLRSTAQQLIKKGVIPEEDVWGGWLGRYQKAIREAALELERETREPGRPRDREDRRSHGR